MDPQTDHVIKAVGLVMILIPHLAPLGAALTTLSPLFAGPSANSKIMAKLKEIDSNIALM